MAHNTHFQELYTYLVHLALCPAWKFITIEQKPSGSAYSKTQTLYYFLTYNTG